MDNVKAALIKIYRIHQSLFIVKWIFILHNLLNEKPISERRIRGPEVAEVDSWHPDQEI